MKYYVILERNVIFSRVSELIAKLLLRLQTVLSPTRLPFGRSISAWHLTDSQAFRHSDSQSDRQSETQDGALLFVFCLCFAIGIDSKWQSERGETQNLQWQSIGGLKTIRKAILFLLHLQCKTFHSSALPCTNFER